MPAPVKKDIWRLPGGRPVPKYWKLWRRGVTPGIGRYCLRCKEFKIHCAKGMCYRCYHREYVKEHLERIKAQQKAYKEWTKAHPGKTMGGRKKKVPVKRPKKRFVGLPPKTGDDFFT